MSAEEHWTQTLKELPDVDTDVLVFIPGHDVKIAAYDDELVPCWIDMHGQRWSFDLVTHWRHLPAPPLVLS